jgi:hypothetical protein
MRLRSIIAALTLLATTQAARADFTIAFGTKWLPVRYTRPVSTTGTTGVELLSGFDATDLNNYLGFFFLNGQIGFQIALDLGYGSRHDEATGPGTKSDLSFTQFGFNVGGKFLITKPRAQKVSPYVYLDFYKYFASISTSATLPKGYEGYLGALVSPLGINLAVGAEYFFTQAFSIGAEVFGFKYGYTQGSYDSAPVGIGGANTISQTNHYLSFYTGITLNYRFDIKIQARAREAGEEEEETPRPRKKAPATEEGGELTPKKDKPPENPESVD